MTNSIYFLNRFIYFLNRFIYFLKRFNYFLNWFILLCWIISILFMIVDNFLKTISSANFPIELWLMLKFQMYLMINIKHHFIKVFINFLLNFLMIIDVDLFLLLRMWYFLYLLFDLFHFFWCHCSICRYFC